MNRYRIHLVLALALIASIATALFLGDVPLRASDIFAALSGSGSAQSQIILWDIRIPRILAALATGAALGISGAALQGLMRNPLAEPGLLGVSSTAALGATAALYSGLAISLPFALPLAAIAGALIAVLILTAAAMRVRGIASLILTGVALSSISGALMALLMNFAPNPFSLSDMMSWLMGSVANRSMADLALTLPFMALGAAILWLGRASLSALSLGEDTAASLGVNLRQARISVILGAGLASGAAVALAGAIGFVGLVAPHVVRPFVGHDPARSMVPAAMLGGLILVLADLAVRSMPTMVEIRLGVLTALIGAPFFLLIALQRGHVRHG
jgi:iron complex transport system permease protein